MCQKWYVLLACDAKATPQILNYDRKMLLVSLLQFEFSSKFLQIEKDWLSEHWLNDHRTSYQQRTVRYRLLVLNYHKNDGAGMITAVNWNLE